MMKLLLPAIILLAIAFAGFAIRVIVKKNGEFKKSCSVTDPKTGKPFGCTCGSNGKDQTQCENFNEHHPGEAGK
ncbi:MAG TPA: hypothetical protein PLB59_05735 [Bacteroidales bacterium]|jgi:hypothetical protein|nr:hypothetical protein [Bacteroidales bacterium]HPB25543.1 hypothetical protein [Bacteroidales bacterium]HPI29076.1 hypothetical protein [Bacteroidales bacterium]HQN15812.1 hypothetical protein [Bacteroidales bacterium]HQP15448.1 hypothetical protein [Bacteroidales bacterium]